jgi:hypothetical protein
VLDDAERQSIREWFRALVRSRDARGAPETPHDGSLTGDLDVPGSLAANVKGGGEGCPPTTPPDEPDVA